MRRQSSSSWKRVVSVGGVVIRAGLFAVVVLAVVAVGGGITAGRGPAHTAGGDAKMFQSKFSEVGSIAS